MYTRQPFPVQRELSASGRRVPGHRQIFSINKILCRDTPTNIELTTSESGGYTQSELQILAKVNLPKVPMTLLHSNLEKNRTFVQPNAFPPLPKNPKKQFAIFTCMDTRLVDFLEPAMGIRRGDAKVIKNAGNTVIDPFGGVVRSLVAAIFMLGVEEVFVIGHKDCGMASVDPPHLKAQMIARGIAPATHAEVPIRPPE